MYQNQNFQSNGFQNQSGFNNMTSQYRGLETKFQPIGYVQSQYNQSPSYNNQFQNNNSYSNMQAQSPQNYHTSNYVGNQQGHDSYLRADSTQPSQSQFATGYTNQNQGSFSMGSGYSNQQFAQQSPQSFHTANYRGDQQGHDAYLRADSTQPAQTQFGMGASSFNSFNSGINNSNQFGYAQQSQGYNQIQNPQSYHTASYRGNQQGHDSYLRSDSAQPAQNQSQSQYGMGTTFSRYQF